MKIKRREIDLRGGGGERICLEEVYARTGEHKAPKFGVGFVVETTLVQGAFGDEHERV